MLACPALGGAARANWSNYCQENWEPFQPCTVGPPSADDHRVGTFAMIRGYGNDAPPGENLVVSFTNTGCTETTTPIQVYWGFWNGGTGALQAWEVGTIGPTKVGKTSSFEFSVPSPPDGTGWSGGLRIAFSWPDTKRCNDFAPAYSGTWKLSDGPPMKHFPAGRVSLDGGPSFDIESLARGSYQTPRGPGSPQSSSDFAVDVKASEGSPALIKDSANGTLFPKATIVLYKAGTSTVDLTLKLTHVSITSWSRAGGEPPTDVFVLSGRSD